MSEAPLKLVANDATDLTVISACVQDALAAISDIAWRKEDEQLVLVLNRFMWERREDYAEGGRLFYRTHALLQIDAVTGVRSRGYERGDAGRILSLMSLRPFDGGVDLLFAEDAAIRVTAPELHVGLKDVGEPWPTRWRPGHSTE